MQNFRIIFTHMSAKIQSYGLLVCLCSLFRCKWNLYIWITVLVYHFRWNSSLQIVNDDWWRCITLYSWSVWCLIKAFSQLCICWKPDFEGNSVCTVKLSGVSEEMRVWKEKNAGLRVITKSKSQRIWTSSRSQIGAHWKFSSFWGTWSWKKKCR